MRGTRRDFIWGVPVVGQDRDRLVMFTRDFLLDREEIRIQYFVVTVPVTRLSGFRHFVWTFCLV